MIEINDKTDEESVQKIIDIGYPENKQYLDQLLVWTADPNWPIAGSIYQYFRQLGDHEANRVVNTAIHADDSWRYALITQLISDYDLQESEYARDWLKLWASNPGSDECDIAALDALVEQDAIDQEDLLKITRKNLFYYNTMIVETMRLMHIGLHSKPFKDHTL